MGGCLHIVCCFYAWPPFDFLFLLFGAIFMSEIVLILLGRCQRFWINIKKVLVYRNVDLFFLLGLKSQFKMARFRTEWKFCFLWDVGTRSQNRHSCPISTLFLSFIAPCSPREDGNLLLHLLSLVEVQEGPGWVHYRSSCYIHFKSQYHWLPESNQNS